MRCRATSVAKKNLRNNFAILGIELFASSDQSICEHEGVFYDKFSKLRVLSCYTSMIYNVSLNNFEDRGSARSGLNGYLL